MWPRVGRSGESSWLEWSLDLGETRIGNRVRVQLELQLD